MDRSGPGFWTVHFFFIINMDIFNIFNKYSLNFFIPYTVYGVIGLFKYSAAVSSMNKKGLRKPITWHTE